MFNRGGHVDERAKSHKYRFHMERVNNIGFRHMPRSWVIDVSKDDHNIAQGCTGQVTLISISDHLLDAILEDHGTAVLILNDVWGT